MLRTRPKLVILACPKMTLIVVASAEDVREGYDLNSGFWHKSFGVLLHTDDGEESGWSPPRPPWIWPNLTVKSIETPHSFSRFSPTWQREGIEVSS